MSTLRDYSTRNSVWIQTAIRVWHWMQEDRRKGGGLPMHSSYRQPDLCQPARESGNKHHGLQGLEEMGVSGYGSVIYKVGHF